MTKKEIKVWAMNFEPVCVTMTDKIGELFNVVNLPGLGYIYDLNLYEGGELKKTKRVGCDCLWQIVKGLLDYDMAEVTINPESLKEIIDYED